MFFCFNSNKIDVTAFCFCYDLIEVILQENKWSKNQSLYRIACEHISFLKVY